MTDRTVSAPQFCIQCGQPAKIPIGEQPLCTNKGCVFFDKETRGKWLQESKNG